MNNREGNMGDFNAGMGMFNNLMGSFSDSMRNMGNSATNGTQNLGESLGNWGQQMGQWGQSMAGLFGGGNTNSDNNNNNNNTRQNNRQSNRQTNNPTQDPNFNPFDYVNMGNNANTNNYFSNGNANSGQNYYTQTQANYGPYTPPPDNRQSQRQQQQNFEQRQRNRVSPTNRRDSNSEQYRPNRRARPVQIEQDKLLFNEAKAHIRAGEIDTAIDKIVRAMEIGDATKYSQILGYCYLKKHDFNLATALFKEMLATDPNNSKLHRYIGICYMEKAKLTSSIELINEGVDHFCTAYEVTNSELNHKNYLSAKKLRFLALAEMEQLRKANLVDKLQKYSIKSIDSYLKKTYLEKRINIPEHFRCAITLVT